MKNTITTTLFLFFYALGQCCSFDKLPFCQTINNNNPENVVLRGYFSDNLSNGLIFTRLETLRGDEERNQINVWDNIPFDCNGLHERNASNMGAINQEVIISLTLIDSLYSDFEIIGDYRVPNGLWWETHNLEVVGDSVTGYYIFSESNPSVETIHYDEFIEKVIEKNQCISTSTKDISVKSINVYPTLVNDYVNIDISADLEQSNLYVYNISGNQLMAQSLSSQIYLGRLAKGMYIVVVQTKDNICYHQKIIKF